MQITTAHKLSPGSHAIHAIGDRGILPYKPSTPIGEYTRQSNSGAKNSIPAKRLRARVRFSPRSRPYSRTTTDLVFPLLRRLYPTSISPMTVTATVKSIIKRDMFVVSKYFELIENLWKPRGLIVGIDAPIPVEGKVE